MEGLLFCFYSHTFFIRNNRENKSHRDKALNDGCICEYNLFATKTLVKWRAEGAYKDQKKRCGHEVEPCFVFSWDSQACSSTQEDLYPTHRITTVWLWATGLLCVAKCDEYLF